MSNFSLLSLRSRRARPNMNIVFSNQSQRVTQTTNVPKPVKKQVEKKLAEEKLAEKKSKSIVWKRIPGKSKTEKRREREARVAAENKARAAAEKMNVEKRIKDLKKKYLQANKKDLGILQDDVDLELLQDDADLELLRCRP